MVPAVVRKRLSPLELECAARVVVLEGHLAGVVTLVILQARPVPKRVVTIVAAIACRTMAAFFVDGVLVGILSGTPVKAALTASSNPELTMICS